MSNCYKLYTAADAAEVKYYKDILCYDEFMKQEDWWVSFTAFRNQVVSEHVELVDEGDIRCNRAAEIACTLLSNDSHVIGVVFLHDPRKIQSAA